jgi:ISXO2-like transposase domain
MIRGSVLPGSIKITDAHGSSSSLASCGYRHIALNHKRGEWVRDGLAMARVESYWTSLKYFLRSHNWKLKQETLPLYLAEHSFRHNLRQRGEKVFEALIAKFPPIDRSQLPKGAAPVRERSEQLGDRASQAQSTTLGSAPCCTCEGMD